MSLYDGVRRNVDAKIVRLFFFGLALIAGTTWIGPRVAVAGLVGGCALTLYFIHRRIDKMEAIHRGR